MKICPFISHMFGDDSANTLTIDDDNSVESSSATDNVVVLGYDEGQTAVETKPETKSGEASGLASGLYCLEDSCRFYRKKSGECQFDVMFKALDAQKKSTKSKTDDTGELKKDLDKIWKFQTQSVAELVESFADSDRKHSENVTELRDDVRKDLEELAGKISAPAAPNGLELKVEELNKRIAEREESVDNLSTTISEMVVNLQEGIDRLREKSDGMLTQVDQLQREFPTTEKIKEAVDLSVSNQVKAIEMPNLDEAFRALEGKVEEILRQDDASAHLEEKLEETLRVHRELEQRLTDWQRRIEENMDEIKTQQRGWDDRLGQLGDKQQEVAKFLEESAQRRENEQKRQNKKDAKKYNNLGVTSFHNGAFEMAKEQFLKAVSLDPEFAEAYNNLGLAYTEMNLEDKATEAFERAVDMNPSLHAAYNNLGYIFFKQGNYDQAVEMYNEALGRSTNNSSAYTNLGNAYYKMDKLDEARTAWEKALELDPGNEKAKRNLERINQ